MHIHINSIDKDVWDIIANGPNQITSTNGPNQITMTNGEGVIVQKPENQWNDNDKKLCSRDWKA